MSITFIIGIVVILSWGIYFILIGASRIIADRVTKNLNEKQ
ncbi:MAG: hypothetical protein SFU98_11385 [Leptospiraceae bacterium]|nr:hypothetical protein [Leptospiraceae bacterium]